MNMQISKRQGQIVEAIKVLGTASYSDISLKLSENFAERTIKRDLAELVDLGYLHVTGGGRSTEYSLTVEGRLFLPTDAEAYNATEPSERTGVLAHYQFSLWEHWPTSLVDRDELGELKAASIKYRERSTKQTPELHRKELERFVIEMSWKSSRIEGNTYTLLDTELLIKDGVASNTNTAEETIMILNHKRAFEFVLAHEHQFAGPLSFALIETIHQYLMNDLIREPGLRTGIVGITGSNYQPLDNQHQIREAMAALIQTINRIQDPYSKALTALLGISYIQPFTDGNKRTARLLANGLLLGGDCAPLSYRDVDERIYRASLLVFYEQLSTIPMKTLFKDQYGFSTEHYVGI